MKNKTVKLILGVVLLAALTGGYFGVKSYVANQEEAESEQEEEKTSVFATDTNDITSLKFMIDQKEVTFVKEDETWSNKDEKEFPVDQEKLTNAASYISSVNADRVLENVDDLGEYGLDNPENTITISSGEEDTILRVGIKNESTNQYYINKNEDKNTVYVVEESLISPFMNSLYDYAEMQTFPNIEATQMLKITVSQKENFYEVQKDSNTGTWSLENNGEQEKADSTQMNSLTSSIGSLEYDSFADYNCTDKTKYGLENPYAILTVEYEEKAETSQDISEDDTLSAEDSEAEELSETSEIIDESDDSDTDENTTDSESSEDTEPEMLTKQLTVLIGNEADSDCRYVMLEGSKEVYTMTEDLLSTAIDKDVSTMLDKTVYYLPLNELGSIDVELNEQKNTINVSRETIEVEDEDENDTEDVDNSTEDLEENSDTADSENDTKTETIVKYTMDGNELDDLKFSSFYNKLINLTGQKRLMEDYHPENTPDMSVVFHNLDNESVNVDFYEYDVNYFAAIVDKRVYLLNKMSFREMRDSYEELITEETSE